MQDEQSLPNFLCYFPVAVSDFFFRVLQTGFKPRAKLRFGVHATFSGKVN